MQLHLSWSRSTTCRSPSFGSSALPGAKRFLTTISHRSVFDGILRCWALFSAACPDKLMQIWRPSLTPRPRLNISTARGEPPTSTTASCRRTAQAPTRHYCNDLFRQKTTIAGGVRPRMAMGAHPTSVVGRASGAAHGYCKDLYSGLFVYGTACRNMWFTARVFRHSRVP